MVALAARAYQATPAVPLTSPDSPPVEKEFDRVVNLIYSGPLLGTANIMKGGTTQTRHTGNWRLFKPLSRGPYETLAPRYDQLPVRVPVEEGFPALIYQRQFVPPQDMMADPKP